jgi:polyisoprenoid-binding protein YceI
VKSKIIGGSIEIESNYPLDPSVGKLPDLKLVPKVDVSIPVSSLKSDNKRMDEVMLEHMKYPEFQKITYKLTELKPKAGEHKAGDPIEFDSKGEITIAGVAKSYDMSIKVEKLEGNKLKVTGSTPLKMTSHGLKPPAPALALGLIKVGDDVTVSFEWITQQKIEAAK